MAQDTAAEGAHVRIVERFDVAVVAMNQLLESSVRLDLLEKRRYGARQAVVLAVIVGPAQLPRLADLEADAQFREEAALQRDLVRIGDQVVDFARVDLLDQFLAADVVDLDPGQVGMQTEFVAQQADVRAAADDLERTTDEVAGMARPLDVVTAVEHLVGDLVITGAVGHRTTEFGLTLGQARGDDVAAAEQKLRVQFGEGRHQFEARLHPDGLGKPVGEVVLEAIETVDILVVGGRAVQRQYLEVAALLDFLQLGERVPIDPGRNDQHHEDRRGREQARD